MLNRLSCCLLGLLVFLTACVGGAGPDPVHLRVLSYNVKHGDGLGDTPIAQNLLTQAQIIRGAQADLVGLQEIDQGCKRSGGGNQTQDFARRCGLRGAFGKFMDFQGGQYGLALLSRFPVDEVEVLRLPAGRREPRVALLQVIEPEPGLRIVFVNLHFDWLKDSTQRLAQARVLLARLDALGLPAIVVGDYNAQPGSPTCEAFRAAGFELLAKQQQPFTFPADRPRVEIDHIALRGTAAVEIWGDPISVLPERQASDHRPIATDVYLRRRRP